ncbi:ABC transporter ATP-binding protein [Skermanella stibiiresistens SB22]|uniref:ABC transporter ATP-binding protein n=1 Tax=Skermanella stibiiresistens SB22 TaxID=1385369 RepID=W9H052_9PROT|nr:ABC transporter ATP-binding protein [Skermanella stibiiresistens]EWY39565.1 ABC transporter ATP-binding protein [Skermanella stibiiresistens SB22]
MLSDPIDSPTSAPTRRPSSPAPTQPILEVIDATHAYDGVVALENVTVTAAPGEFLTILGESGSGKTTLLRLISGLEKPYRIGALRLGGVDVREVPAFLRDCTTVFQNYALFPHLTVGANVEYGLKVRGIAAAERRTRARQALELVQLADMYDRKIHQLSGGQRQRVALARALVPQPAILLLDEPLGALDEKLRVDMQVELLELQKRLGMTFIYITHSQEEALTMSDRIILMRKGKIEQEGPPTTIFDRPVSSFAARFMGVENCFDAELTGVSGSDALIRVGDHHLIGRWSGRKPPKAGAKVAVGIRAERLRLARAAPTGPDLNVLPCRGGGAIYKGKYLDRAVETDVAPMKARIWDASAADGEPSCVWWRKDDCIVMEP